MKGSEIDFKDREALEGQVSDRGVVGLKWEGDGEAIFEVQQATNSDFSTPITRYQGTDTGTVLTGLAEGVYYFRIRKVGSEPAAWSPPLEYRVEFVPRSQLFLLLGIGFTVVVATIGSIVVGHVKSNRKDGAR